MQEWESFAFVYFLAIQMHCNSLVCLVDGYEMSSSPQNENRHYLLTLMSFHTCMLFYSWTIMEFRRSFQQQLVTMRFEKGRVSVFNNLNFSLFLTKLSYIASKDLNAHHDFYWLLLSLLFFFFFELDSKVATNFFHSHT